MNDSVFLFNISGNHETVLMLSTISLSLSLIGLILYLGYLQFVKSEKAVAWSKISEFSSEFKNLFSENLNGFSSRRRLQVQHRNLNKNFERNKYRNKFFKSLKSVNDQDEASRFLDHYLWKYMGIRYDEKDFLLIDFNLYDLLNEIINEEHQELANSNLKIYLDVNEKSVVKSDKLKVKSMLKNVLKNAIANQDSKKTHTYLKISFNYSKSSFSLVLSDNGLGLSAEHLPDIFSSHQNPKKQFKNSDFSLFLIKEYAKKLNIDFKVYSENGEGSMFVFEFDNTTKSNSKNKVLNVLAN